ncbi:DUF4215 domain-containing protein [Myxococcus sp. K15C18031901]|uniref:DUF4215 domain-containing protein n=1 Tax=Myxococcus dinghuensis TaxID=2906761 RepID=UPI0020A774C3|nr:DUF4215 domain-containing protein [Myxococcus dinghuensis]MCP3100276.1 DUF4215 domain-containing protein [Myxococcus dinghuensis]
MNTRVIESPCREPLGTGRSRTARPFAALALALLTVLTGCEENPAPAPVPTAEEVLVSQSASLVGDGRLQVGEQCDDGNTTSGDGCSATGAIEDGYLCHVPGRPCSLASLCGNNVINTGEACDDGNTAAGTNGCTADCDLSLCGNGASNNRQYPNFDQEICDDGNRVEGDGCSRLCEVEPGFACAGNPSRCVRAGVVFFNTGVDQNNRRLESGVDSHWFYVEDNVGATPGVRNANDWPQELQTARYMASRGTSTCVYQDFLIPSTTTVANFRMRLATFNDNEFESAQVNGTSITPVVVSAPGGQPWQKNIIRELGTNAAWRTGLNRVQLCNENETSPPNAFRYLFVDAFDDRCGDGVVSVREDCDDGNTNNNDGCSATCGIEPGYGCAGAPSSCARTCGNGAINPGEQCDDGNLTAGDGCDASCRVEAGHACPTPGQACVATCGNGVINAGEQCDDGNVVNSDGCSASCRVERGYECTGAPSTCAPLCGNSRLDPGELCDDGNTTANDGCSIACTLELGYSCPTVGQPCAQTCGNGTVDPGEQCDDGNLTSGDGCATECSVEPGYSCSRPSSGASVCQATCGNGTVDANETCDDGNTTNGDGCSQGCAVEAGYQCSGAPSTCATLCGDGIRAGAEACDDGNTTNGDGCSNTCGVEPGWRCPPPGNVCFNTCGNGTVESGEQCDDGDTTGGDGCSATCAVEPGYSCSGTPSDCRTTCGDGVVAGTEVCDDGNLESGDTCSPRCLWEVGQPCSASGVCDSGVCNPNTDRCVLANVCGNGMIDEGEQCDDTNTTAGDGCSAACAIEAGYSCTGNPSTCAVTCGDGVKAASEACDDGNTTNGDGCSATCAVEAGSACHNADIHAFYTRNGRNQCTQVTSVTTPSLPAGEVQAALTVPGRFRASYVAGAVSYSGGANWYPGVFGFNHATAAGAQQFSLGYVPASGPGAATRDEAMVRGFTQHRDFDAVTGDVRVALVDTDCATNNNSDTSSTYRVDSLSICQLIPVLTDPTPGGTSDPTIGGNGTPGATIEVYVDGGTTPACTAVVDASGHWTCNLGNISEGPHDVVLTTTTLGVTETAPEVEIVITRTPPTTPVITGPTSGATLPTLTPAISGTAEPGDTVTVREGTTVVCTAVADASGHWTCTPATPMTEGPHEVVAVATNGNGATSAPSVPVPFTLDVTPPAAPVISGPENGSLTNDNTPAISGTGTPGSTVTVREGTTVVCTALVDASGHWTCTPATPLADGTHTVTATATDAAGNHSPQSNADTFRIDTQAPDTSFSRSPPARADVGEAPFAYSATEQNVRYECSLDGRPYGPCQDTYNVGLGEHVLRVRATDEAGNVDASPAEYRWTVVETRAFAGGGCSAAPAPAWLGLLGLLGLRRRKRR